jgi:hypothetical protein
VRRVECSIAGGGDLSRALNSTLRSQSRGVVPPEGDWWTSIPVLNGSMAAIGGIRASGIGIWNTSDSGTTATVRTITIENGNITANGGDSGGRIGTAPPTRGCDGWTAAPLRDRSPRLQHVDPSAVLISNASLLFGTDCARLFSVRRTPF